MSFIVHLASHFRNNICASLFAQLGLHISGPVRHSEAVSKDKAPAATEQHRSQPKRLGDPRELKALAHPLRMRLVVELATQGSARAVDLAKAVGEPANSVSFHLRQLARYGLILEDPERSNDGRERWWRLASDAGFQTDMSELRKLPGGPQAVGAMVNLNQDIARATMTVAFEDCDQPDGPLSWFNSFGLHLSRTEIEQFRDEEWELISRWMQRSRQLAASGDGVQRRTYVSFAFGAAVDEVLLAEEDTPARTD